MFKRIDLYETKSEIKYKVVAIVGNNGVMVEYTGISKATNHSNQAIYDFWKTIPRIIPPLTYEETFYEFVSQKSRIQSDMEHRAVNKIVQIILGDPYFQW